MPCLLRRTAAHSLSGSTLEKISRFSRSVNLSMSRPISFDTGRQRSDRLLVGVDDLARVGDAEILGGGDVGVALRLLVVVRDLDRGRCRPSPVARPCPSDHGVERILVGDDEIADRHAWRSARPPASGAIFFCSGVKLFQVSRFMKKPIAGPVRPSGVVHDVLRDVAIAEGAQPVDGCRAGNRDRRAAAGRPPRPAWRRPAPCRPS